MNKIFITGATGLLGSTLVPYLAGCGHILITNARKKGADFLFDLSDSDRTIQCLEQIRPDFIINLVGLTSVDICEEQPNAAYLANTRPVENLVNWASHSAKNCHLIQISTDQVYDGLGPHSEDEVTLTNTYALTKYAGELAAAQVPGTILRTNFVGRSKTPKRESLSDWVYNAMRSGQDVQVLTDVLFSPLSMHTLVQMIELIVERKPVGVFNLGSRGGMSKADFVFLLAERLGLSTATMSRIDCTQATFLKTYRPKDMRMDCSKIEKILGIRIPLLTDELNIITSEYDDEA